MPNLEEESFNDDDDDTLTFKTRVRKERARTYLKAIFYSKSLKFSKILNYTVSKIYYSILQMSKKKTLLKKICDYKMLPFALVLIQTKKSSFFDQLFRKCSFYMRI